VGLLFVAVYYVLMRPRSQGVEQTTTYKNGRWRISLLFAALRFSKDFEFVPESLTII
jgi:hypothetical protein